MGHGIVNLCVGTSGPKCWDFRAKTKEATFCAVSMKMFSLTVTVCMLILLMPLAYASTAVGGQDVNPEPGEAPFTIITRDSPSIDSEAWSLAVEMNQEEHDNNTVFELTTQICTNNGVCDPPMKATIGIEDRLHSIEITPKSDHTYVNWRVKAIYEDGNTTNFPQGSWYTTWSSCWQNDGAYGGVDANPAKDGCAESEDSPGFGALLAVSGVAMAAAFIRRD